MAAFVSNSSCKGDGTFSLESSLARPSAYCRATHFPGFPNTLGSALLVGAVYLTPLLVVGLGWLVAARRASGRIWTLSTAWAIVLAAGVLVFSLAASQVGYAGGG
jgi:hypothetical protein